MSFQQEDVFDRTINQYHEAIALLLKIEKLLNETIAKMNFFTQYKMQSNYENVILHLKEVKATTETLLTENVSNVRDLEKIKNRLANHQVPNEEQQRLEKELQKNLQSSSQALVDYKELFQHTIEYLSFEMDEENIRLYS